MSKKILIITPSWIGDCVMTQPLYRRLHELHPGCTIDAFAPKWSMAVFERMPEISRVIENPFGHGALELKKRWRIGRELGKQGYDQVIVLPGSLKSALIAFATGIKQRTGYVGESRYLLLNDIRKLDKVALPLMVDRYTALAHPTQADFNGHSDNPRFTISPESRAAALAKYGLNTDKPVLAFCPGAEYGPAKRWPARILPNSAAAIWQKAGRFGSLVRKKISTSPKKSTDFQTASAPTSAAKPTFPKRLTCSPAPTPSSVTTAA